MKRDAEYMKELLLEFEDNECFTISDPTYIGMPLDERKRHYHIQLLCDQGFIVPCNPYSESSMLRLTAEAHDFIEKIREPKFWDKVQNEVKENTGLDIKEVGWTILVNTVKSLSYVKGN